MLSNTNKSTFSKLKDTINQEENNLLNKLSDLRTKVQIYLNEEEIMSKQSENSLYK
jgi:hypothetical protein